MNIYTVYFDGYLTVMGENEEEAKRKVSSKLDEVAESYEITDVEQ